MNFENHIINDLELGIKEIYNQFFKSLINNGKLCLSISNCAHLVIRHIIIVSPFYFEKSVYSLLSQSVSFLLNEHLINYMKLKADAVWGPLGNVGILKSLILCPQKNSVELILMRYTWIFYTP